MEGTLRQIALSDIQDHVGSPPSTRFRKSVRRMGIVQPVVVLETTQESGEVRYQIIDGNRRISAARTARMKTVSAIVLTDLTSAQVAQLTLVLNSFRSANYLTEFWAIKSLTRSNFSIEEIQDLAGFANSSMDHRDSFTRLNREIFVALRNGKVSQANASAIAKLPPSSQEQLAARFREKGYLAKWEVDEVTRSVRESAKATSSTSREREPIRFITPASVSQPASWDRFTAPAAIAAGDGDIGRQPESDARAVDAYDQVAPPVDHLENIARSTKPIITEPSVPAAPHSIIPSSSESAVSADDIDHQPERDARAVDAHVEVALPVAQSGNIGQSTEPITAEPSVLAPNHSSLPWSENEATHLELNEQVETLHQFREQLMDAAELASQLGMDRLRFLTQASQIWDKRETSRNQRPLAFDGVHHTDLAQINSMQQEIPMHGRLTSAD